MRRTSVTATIVTDEQALNYHLMHPGGDSSPGDPNAIFFLDGVCHLHYILKHQLAGRAPPTLLCT